MRTGKRERKRKQEEEIDGKNPRDLDFVLGLIISSL